MKQQRHRQPEREPPILGGRVPPNDLLAEAAVLSAAMLDKDATATALEILQADDFYSDDHRLVFEAIATLAKKGKPADLVTVAGILRDEQVIQRAGGAKYLGELIDATPAVANVATHATKVREKKRLRQLIAACQKYAGLGYGRIPDGDEQAFIVEAELAISQVAHTREESEPEDLKPVMTRLFSKLSEAAERGDNITGTPTRFVDLDKKTAGLHPGDLMIIAARPGMGKAQPLDARVLTPTGWRTMGSLTEGDEVIGASGEPVRVLGVYDQGVLPVYRVTMKDGGSTRCCGEHLWATRTRADRRSGRGPEARSTEEVRATLLRGDGKAANHSIPRVAPVHFRPFAHALPIDPYVLGAWLGDGSCPGSAMLHNPELDIIERVRERLPGGDIITHAERCSWRITGGATVEALRDLGLFKLRSWEKFIPEMYLRAGIEARIELLRGLCDTDGFVTGSRLVEYTTTSMALMAGIVELVGGLGGTCTWAMKDTHYTKGGERISCRPAARATLRLPTGDIVPVSSLKHLARWRTGPGRLAERYIESVDPDGSEPCRCIRVDAPDQLYVTDDFIVTHNTSIVLNIATNVASPMPVAGGDDRPGEGVAVFSLEMPKEQVAMRMVCSEARVDVGRFRQGNLYADDWQRLTEAGRTLAELPIKIDDTGGITLLEARSKVTRLRAEWAKRGIKLGLVIVDYLQLMSGPGDNREGEVSAISRGLKKLAKDFGVPVIALSQLNRGVETRASKNKRPQLSDLRESGAVEQDSDTVIFIYRDEYYDKETKDRGIAEIIIAKQRNGPTGTVRTRFISSYTRFESLAPGEFEDWQTEAYDQ